MRACRRCGEAVPQLWVQALGFLATLTAQELAAEAEEEAQEQADAAGGASAGGVGGAGPSGAAAGEGAFQAAVVEAIEAVEREGLLQPPLLLQLLAQSELVRVELVRGHRTRQLAPSLRRHRHPHPHSRSRPRPHPRPRPLLDQVRGYLTRQLEREARRTEESEREAARFEEETGRMREEIHDLASQASPSPEPSS
jgi:hypothetical protein